MTHQKALAHLSTVLARDGSALAGLLTPPAKKGQAPRRLTISGIMLSPEGFHATVGGTIVPLAPQELKVLRVLMENAGRALSRRELLDQCWSPGYPDGNQTLDTHIRRLRNKLATDRPAPIRTVRNVGYIFDVSGERF